MALNHSVAAFIKSTQTQRDFTQLLKEALHTIFLCQSQGLQTKKKEKKRNTKPFLQIVQGDMTQILQHLSMYIEENISMIVD